MINADIYVSSLLFPSKQPHFLLFVDDVKIYIVLTMLKHFYKTIYNMDSLIPVYVE